MKRNSIPPLLLALGTLVRQIASIAIDNGVTGQPDVVCLETGMEISIKTRRPFHGQVFVKGLLNNPNCHMDNSQEPSDSSTHVLLKLPYKDCSVARSRNVNPSGMTMMSVVIVQFHTVLLTKVDRAYRVRCFYMEATKQVEQGYSVSMIPTTEIYQSQDMPQCHYELLKENLNGPPVKFANIGDPVFHLWSCESHNSGGYGMLVHSCIAKDSVGHSYKLLDDKGCALDPTALTNLVYDNDQRRAWVQAHVFRFASEMMVSFQCEVKLCIKKTGGCDNVTPPKCGPMTLPKVPKGAQSIDDREIVEDKRPPFKPIPYEKTRRRPQRPYPTGLERYEMLPSERPPVFPSPAFDRYYNKQRIRLRNKPLVNVPKIDVGSEKSKRPDGDKGSTRYSTSRRTKVPSVSNTDLQRIVDNPLPKVPSSNFGMTKPVSSPVPPPTKRVPENNFLKRPSRTEKPPPRGSPPTASPPGFLPVPFIWDNQIPLPITFRPTNLMDLPLPAVEDFPRTRKRKKQARKTKDISKTSRDFVFDKLRDPMDLDISSDEIFVFNLDDSFAESLSPELRTTISNSSSPLNSGTGLTARPTTEGEEACISKLRMIQILTGVVVLFSILLIILAFCQRRYYLRKLSQATPSSCTATGSMTPTYI